MSWLAVTMWQLGEVDRARELVEAVNRHAAELGHAPSMAHPLQAKFFLEILRGDAAAALGAAEALEVLGRDHGMPYWRGTAERFAVWARGRLHDPAAGAAELERTIAVSAEQGMRGGNWFSLTLQAELEFRTNKLDSALACIDEALALAARTEYRINLPFAHLLRGEILLGRDPANPVPAEEAFQTAIAVAKQQGARSWGLRAAHALAKLYCATARPAEGHAVLAPALEGFSPTPEMPEIAEAETLLAAVAQTDEFKAQADQRRRLTQLHVAYGNALVAARGYGAAETTEAFAKASSRRLTKRTRQNDWRPTGAYGLAPTCVETCHRCGRTRRPSCATSKQDPIPPRLASRIAPPGSFAGSPASIARRGIIWNARSPCSNPAATMIWPFASAMTPASAQCFTWRLRYGLSARSSARFHSSTACRRGSRTSPMSARSHLEECTRPCSI